MRNMYRKHVRGAATRAALGRTETSVERNNDIPTSWKSTAKNQAMRAMTTSNMKMRVCLPSWFAPNLGLSRCSKLLRMVCGSAFPSLVVLMDVPPAGPGKTMWAFWGTSST